MAAALVCGALALAGCGDSTLPLPAEGAPRELEFSIGGFGGSSTLLELEGETLVVRRVPWGEDGRPGTVSTVRVTPTAADWREFWENVDAAGVRQWRREYHAEHIADGLGWGVRIGVERGVLQSQGSNAYPDRRGREHEGEMTDAFRTFLDALAGLIGEPL
jgi:hypothetical protein